MTGLAIRSPDDIRQMVELIGGAAQLPKHIRSARDLALALTTAADLGLPPTVAIRGMHVINGKVELDATTVRGLLKRAGYGIRWVDSDHVRAELHLWDPGRDKSGEPDHVEVFTIEMAQRAGLLKNDTWRKYPEAMLKARATSAAVRNYAAEVALGGVYAEGEISIGTEHEQRAPRRDVVDATFEEEPAPAMPECFEEHDFCDLYGQGVQIQNGTATLEDTPDEEISQRDAILCAWLRKHIGTLTSMDGPTKRAAMPVLVAAAESAGWTEETLWDEVKALAAARGVAKGEEE